MASKSTVRINQIRAFNGINKRTGARDGECSDARNMVTDDFPALSVRKRSKPYMQELFQDASDVYQCDGSIFVVQGSKLYRDGEELADVTAGQKQWGLVNNQLVIWPDAIIVNLQKGDVRRINETVEGTFTISNGKLHMVGATGRTGSATWSETSYFREWVTVNGWSQEGNSEGKLLPIYRGLTYKNNQWSYTAKKFLVGWSNLDGTTDIDVSGGWYFCGETPNLISYRKNYWEDDPAVPEPSGTGVLSEVKTAKVTKKRTEVQNGSQDTSTTIKYDYNITYATYGAGAKLSEIFESGDTVKITGCVLPVNNDKDYLLKNVKENDAEITGWISGVYYWTADKAYAAGNYLVSNDGNTYNITRDLVKGERLYISSGVLYVYSADSEVTETFQKATQTQINRNGTKATIVFYQYNAGSTETLTIKREAPDFDFICSHNNRLYGVSNKEEGKVYNENEKKIEKVYSRVLHGSELGKPTRFTSYNGNAMDSYSVAIGGSGDFTALCEYGGAVLAWKEDKLYRLTGDFPAEFYLREYNIDGVKAGCNRSLCCINEILYYQSPRGTMAYSGGSPNLISYPLGIDRYIGATSGRDRTTYYLSVRKSNGTNDFFRYDTIHNLWMHESNENVSAVARYGDSALILINGKIWETDGNSDEDEFDWYAELAEVDEGFFNKKNYLSLILDASIQKESAVSVSFKIDNDTEWVPIKTVTTDDGKRWQDRYIIGDGGRRRYIFALPSIRCDRISFRISGTGYATIFAAERRFQIDSERE